MNHSDPIVVGVQNSHLTFVVPTLHKLTELNKILMLACGMGQWEEGGTVGECGSVGRVKQPIT